jgi:hypothetical protein
LGIVNKIKIADHFCTALFTWNKNYNGKDIDGIKVNRLHHTQNDSINYDCKKIVRCLNSKEWEFLNETEDVNECYEKIETHILNIYKDCITNNSNKKNQTGQHNNIKGQINTKSYFKDWVKDSTVKLINEKNKLWNTISKRISHQLKNCVVLKK